MTEGLEQQFGAALGQRHIAQFIDDKQLIAGQQLLEAQQVLFIAGLGSPHDQRRGGGEAYTMTALAGGQAESQGDVSLARATVA